MPSQSGQQQLFAKVEDLPGAKLGEHLHHIFAGIKSRTSTPTSSRNNSVAPSRAQSPTRETARSTASKLATPAPSALQSRSSSQAAKVFGEKGYYAF
ncbi:hypothetical protein Slin15195_G123430 [Septoria linicola]|uniref:Uncharacterized protein n=1 Tax=Septoria linicola TaxID=215465 RepID=A0A9Q9EQQ0_9PEZI|nr:hypothetical protein Slin14017_G079630 [Septoria linicola]USW59024.1 hypothetical protein Slin15195_G123430 [Septoria linicola]